MNASASPTLITQIRVNLSLEDALINRRYCCYDIWPYPICIRDRDNLITQLPYLDFEMEQLAWLIQKCGSVSTFKFYLDKKDIQYQSIIQRMIELSNNNIEEALKNFI